MKKVMYLGFLFLMIFAVSCAQVPSLGDAGSGTSNPNGGSIIPEGTSFSPLALAFGTAALPHAGSVDTTNSYYKITGLISGHKYTISLTGLSADVDLSFYNTDSSFNFLACGSYNNGTFGESCFYTVTGATVYIKVKSYASPGANFNLGITDNGVPVGGGNVAQNITLNFLSLPYSGTVNKTYSYYAVTGLTSAHNYTINLTGLTDDADLAVYLDSNYVTNACYSFRLGTIDESCSANVAGTAVYIVVIGTSTTAGASFSINMIDNGPVPVNEGLVGTPISIAFASFATSAYAGTVGTGKSYYMVTGLTSGNYYSVNVAGLTANADLQFYNADGTFTSSVCSSANVGTTDEVCSFVVTGASAYIKVDGTWSGTGAKYSLSMTDIGSAPVAQGTSIGPISIAYTSLPYAGTVDKTSSYYAITGLTAGHNYSISLTGLNDNADLFFYGVDSNYGQSICGSWYNYSMNDSCSTTVAGPTAYVKVIGGWSSGSGALFTLNMIDLGVAPVSEGTAIAPTPIAFSGTSLNRTSTVGGLPGTMDSYYSVTGLTVGHNYTISLTSLTANANLYFSHIDSTFATYICYSSNGGTLNETCTRTLNVITGNPIGGYIHIHGMDTVNGYYWNSTGASFTLTITDNGQIGSAEGTLSPVSIPHASLPYYGSSGSLSGEHSYYYITGLTVNNYYTISVSNISTNHYVILDFYDWDSSFVNSSCSSGYSNQPNYVTHQACSFKVTSTAGYIRVMTDWPHTGGFYMLNMVDDTPLLITLPTGPFTFEGLVSLPVNYVTSGVSWNIDSTNGSAASSYSIASGVTANFKESCTAIYTNHTTAGSVNFDYKTDSGSGDTLYFYINGVSSGMWSGFTPWTSSITYPLNIGYNELEWCYNKGSGIPVGQDKVWVDNIIIN